MKNLMIGKYVIVRSQGSGVHSGILVSVKRDTVVLSDSRRLWYWFAKQGHSLSGVAMYGLEPEKSKIPVAIPLIQVMGVCEISLCSPEAEKSIREVPEHVQGS